MTSGTENFTTKTSTSAVRTFGETSDGPMMGVSGAVWNDWDTIVPWYILLPREDKFHDMSLPDWGPTGDAPPLSGSATAAVSETTISSTSANGTTTNTAGALATSSSFSSSVSYDNLAKYHRESPGFSTATSGPGSVADGSAHQQETDTSDGTNVYGVVGADYDNRSSETVTYSMFAATDVSPTHGDPYAMVLYSKTLTTSTTETGNYTTGGGAPIMPTSHNPYGYAKFSETRVDDVSAFNLLEKQRTNKGGDANSSGSAAANYLGKATSSLHSDWTVTVDVGQGIDTETGDYTMTGGKTETSDVTQSGSQTIPRDLQQKWTYTHTIGHTIDVNGGGSYGASGPTGGPGAAETSSSTFNKTVTGSYWILWPGGWSAPATESESSSTFSSDGGGGGTSPTDPPVDGPQGAPPESNGPAKPWYNNDWTDNINPAAWIASTAVGIWNGLKGGYEFLTKNHKPGWDDFINGKAARLNEHSHVGDISAYRQAEGKAIAQQADDVLQDAGKYAGGIMAVGDVLTLGAAAPGLAMAGVGLGRAGLSLLGTARTTLSEQFVKKALKGELSGLAAKNVAFGIDRAAAATALGIDLSAVQIRNGVANVSIGFAKMLRAADIRTIAAFLKSQGARTVIVDSGFVINEKLGTVLRYLATTGKTRRIGSGLPGGRVKLIDDSLNIFEIVFPLYE